MVHQYSKKIKNKNPKFAKVGRRIFRSLFDAETFCCKNGRDVDRDIEVAENRDDPKAWEAAVIELAKDQKAILREVIKRLEAHHEELKAQIDQAKLTYEVALQNHDLLTDFYKERWGKALEKSHEAHDCRQLVWKVLEELEGVTGWHD